MGRRTTVHKQCLTGARDSRRSRNSNHYSDSDRHRKRSIQRNPFVQHRRRRKLEQCHNAKDSRRHLSRRNPWTTKRNPRAIQNHSIRQRRKPSCRRQHRIILRLHRNPRIPSSRNLATIHALHSHRSCTNKKEPIQNNSKNHLTPPFFSHTRA